MDHGQFQVMQSLREGVSRRDLFRGLSAFLASTGFGALLQAEDSVEAGRRKRKNRKQQRKRNRQQNSAAKSSCPARTQVCANRCGNVTKQCGSSKRTYSCSPCHAGGTERCDVCVKGCTYADVQAAIDATPAGGTIRVCPGQYKQLLTISRDLTIIGSGQDQDKTKGTHIAGTGADSTLTVLDGAVTLQELRFTEGVGLYGGAIRSKSAGLLTLEQCTLIGNEASGHLSGGGAIAMEGGNLLMNDCLVTNNAAGWLGGGLHLEGTVAQITDTVISHNVSFNEDGGGIQAIFSRTTLTNSRLVENRAQGASGTGGAVNLAGGTLALENSSIDSNYALFQGGGIFVEEGAVVTMDARSTVTFNTASGGGAGILNEGAVTCQATNVYSNITTNCVDSGSGAGCETCNPA